MLQLFFVVNLSILVFTNYVAAVEYSCLNATLSSIPCQDTHISCDQNRDCLVSCSSRQKCSNAIIDCPLTGNCIIECRGSRTCENLIVNATHSRSGSLDVLCEDGKYDQCAGIKIYASAVQENTNQLNLLCNGQGHSCVGAEVSCPLNGDCFVSCNTDSACENSTITGPENAGLLVGCNGPMACADAKIDARHADDLAISGCIQTDACLDVSIHCPPYTNSSAPNCFIEGNDNLVISKLYAVHGWHDVDIEYFGHFNYKSTYHGVFYCGYGYTHHCDLALDAWSCSDATDYCNTIQVDQATDSDHHSDTNHDTDSHHDSDTNHHDTDSDHHGDDSDHHGDDHDTDHHLDYMPPPKKSGFEHGAMGMVLVGGGLIALSILCVICGSIGKAYDKATRKLSDMGFKSPFKSPYQERNLREKYRQAYGLNDLEHSMEESRTSVSRSGYAPQPQPQPQAANKSGQLSRPESHTAHIHRPNSHSGTYTATIHRQDSQSRTKSNRDIPIYPARQHSQHGVGQTHTARALSAHGSYHNSGSSLHSHPATGYYHGVHGHQAHHSVAGTRSKHGHHGSGRGNGGHSKRSTKQNAEMVQIR